MYASRIVPIIALLIAVPAWSWPFSESLDSLATLKPGISQRASSSDPYWKTGNNDYRAIAPGETLVMAELNGPGVIHHIWNTVSTADEKYPHLLAIRIYWDDEKTPSVEAPLGDFFVIGHGLKIPFESALVSVSAEGKARNCFWPMPFRKSARITVTNEGTLPINSFYYYVDWRKMNRIPRHTGYFHAMYRQEYPATIGKRYLLADIVGRGHYVGTVLNVRQRTINWFGEGDDFFYIDGDTEPTLRGTGTEDYFCDAWGFRTFDTPYYGVPLYEGSSSDARTTVYRWHIADPIVFKKSLKAEIEHVGPLILPDGTEMSGYDERPDDFASVAYWYQREPHKPWPAIPVGSARVYPDSCEIDPFKDMPGDVAARWIAGILSATPAAFQVVQCNEPEFSGTTINIPLENRLRFPATFKPNVQPHSLVSATIDQPEILLEPQCAVTVPVRLTVEQPVSFAFMTPLRIDWDVTLERPDGTTLNTAFTSRIRVTGALSCPQVASPITVDGNLDDWPALPFDVSEPAQVRSAVLDWKGPADSHYSFGVCHTDDYLYIGVRVFDDVRGGSPGVVPWNQDGLEIRVVALPDPERSAWRGATDFGNAMFIALSPPWGDTPMVWFDPSQAPQGTIAKCVATPEGFNAEVALPTSYLDQMQGKTWEAFRLNLGLNDIDNGKNRQLWWQPDWRYGQSYYGSGTFWKN